MTIIYGGCNIPSMRANEKDKQFEILSRNYDELEEDKKETLLLIGEKILGIQSLINDEKVSENEKH